MYALGFLESNRNFNIEYKNLLQAIKHLYSALERIEQVKLYFSVGTISSIDIDEDIRSGYLETNRCRLYTEEIVLFEEILIPVLSNFYSVWAMNGQLWEQGYTKYGIRSIITELDNARISLKFCLEYMEDLLNDIGIEEKGEKCEQIPGK